MAFKWNNKAELIGNMQRHAKAFPERLGAAIYQEAEIDATECKQRTPVDTGALRASIHVEGPEYHGKNVSCAIVAGGGITSDYAIVQHEDLEFFHPVGQARFISSVLEESAPHMGPRIAERLQESQK